jgi:hypothetical protein
MSSNDLKIYSHMTILLDQANAPPQAPLELLALLEGMSLGWMSAAQGRERTTLCSQLLVNTALWVPTESF